MPGLILEGSRRSLHYRNGGLILSAFSICWIASLQVNIYIYIYLPVEDPPRIPDMQISECDLTKT